MAHLELPNQPAGPVLELHGQRKRFTIPFGLKSLLEDMTREVLRMNPTNIYGFLADYLDGRLATREEEERRTGKGRHSWEWRRWSWDGSSLLTNDELIAFLAEYNISIEVAQHLATIIQSAYRGFLARQKFHQMQEEHEQRKESLWDEWRHEGNFFVSIKDVLDILSYYGISLFEANMFATKIQSVFRGYLQRRSLALADPEMAAHLDNLGITRHEADKHATRIQSLFRGYKTRKALASIAEGEEEEWGEEELGEFEDNFFQQDLEYVKKRLSMEAEEEEDVRELSEMDSDELEMEQSAATKIQATFRGMRDRKKVKEMRQRLTDEEEGEQTEEEEEEEGQEQAVVAEVAPVVEDEKEKKPKYEAYFPGGYEEKDRVVEPGGIEIPPPFTHEHFGEIDPLAIRKKLSDTQFREKMSYLLKDLNEVKEERLKSRAVSASASQATVAPHGSQATLAPPGSQAPTVAPPGVSQEVKQGQPLKVPPTKILPGVSPTGPPVKTPSGFLESMQEKHEDGEFPNLNTDTEGEEINESDFESEEL